MKLDFDISIGENLSLDIKPSEQIEFDMKDTQVIEVGGGGTGGLTRQEVVEIVKQVAVTQEKDPLVSNWAKSPNKPEYSYSEIKETPTFSKVATTGLFQDLTDASNVKDSITPHISANGNWWIGDTDTGVSATGPQGKPGPAGSISFSVVNSLPNKGNPNIMYLLQYSSTAGNMYYEYIYVDNKWELLGQTNVQVNLDDYVKNSDFPDKVKSVITGSSNTLTVDEQKDAFKWLGIASAEESSLDNKLESATIIGAINELFNKVQALEGFHSKVGSVYIGFTQWSTNAQPLTSEQVKDTNYFTKYPLEDRSATNNPVLVSTTYQLSNIYLCIPKDKTFTSIVINAQGESLDTDVKKQKYTISIDGIDYSVYLNAKISAGTTKFNYTIQQGE